MLTSVFFFKILKGQTNPSLDNSYFEIATNPRRANTSVKNGLKWFETRQKHSRNNQMTGKTRNVGPKNKFPNPKTRPPTKH